MEDFKLTIELERKDGTKMTAEYQVDENIIFSNDWSSILDEMKDDLLEENPLTK